MSSGGYFDYKNDSADVKKQMDNLSMMYRTISFGIEPKKERSLSMVSATSNFKGHRDNSCYVYHEVHLSVPVANDFRPKSPEEILEATTGICMKCASSRSRSVSRADENLAGCEHVNSEADGNKGNLNLKSNLHSILAKKSSHDDSYRNFIKSVSFDTVNISYSDGQEPLYSPRSDDEEDDVVQTRTRWRSQMERGRQLSPSRSLSPTTRDSTSPDFSLGLPFTINEGLESLTSKIIKYPTRPIITHDACTLTKKHNLYDDMYAGRVNGKMPKLPNREVMCYISGRKHTWAAIDWCCNQFLEDGDSLVIVASIRPQGRTLSRLNKPRCNSTSGLPTTFGNITENKIRNSPEWAQATAENIMKYCLAVLNSKRVVKITVELSVGSSAEVLSDMFALYQPSLVVVGGKPSENAPTKSWATKRITDRLVSTLPVPMIIVPSKNMGRFETKLFKALDGRMDFLNEKNNNSVIQRQQILDKMDDVWFYSPKDQYEYILEQGARDSAIEKQLRDTMLETSDIKQKHLAADSNAINSDSDSELSYDDDELSVDSANPPVFQPKKLDIKTELKRLELEYQLKIYQKFKEFEDAPLNENSFKDKLCMVVDAAYKYGVELIDSAQEKDIDHESHKFIREYIGAPEITRTKSMITTSAESVEDAQAAFDAKIKEYQKMGKKTGKKETKNPPKITINEHLTSPATSKSYSINNIPLSSTEKPKLTSSVSQPDVTKKKKKRRGFFGLFK